MVDCFKSSINMHASKVRLHVSIASCTRHMLVWFEFFQTSTEVMAGCLFWFDWGKPLVPSTLLLALRYLYCCWRWEDGMHRSTAQCCITMLWEESGMAQQMLQHTNPQQLRRWSNVGHHPVCAITLMVKSITGYTLLKKTLARTSNDYNYCPFIL